MAQILKVVKKVKKSPRGKSAVFTIQSVELRKFVGKNVIVRVETANNC
jgi:hypothetical protein